MTQVRVVNPLRWRPAALGLGLLVSLFVLGELTLRRFRPAGPSGPASAVMLSSRHVELDRFGAIRHIPNENVRAVAVYHGRIEYDATAHSNSLGLLDHEDYRRGPGADGAAARFAFVGDSFTSGLGAEPWVPKLRDTLRRRDGDDIQIYNLGVAGTGVQHFQKLLASLSHELSFTDVVVLAISNDFYRPAWVPVSSDTEVRACRPQDVDKCVKYRKPTIIFGFSDSEDRILARTKVQAGAADGTPMWRTVAARSRMLMAAKNRVTRLFEQPARAQALYNSSYLVDGAELENNVRALAGIAAAHRGRPVHLVHLPQKDEVVAGHYKLELSKIVEELGVRYHPALSECRWSADLFYPNDDHPNRLGYEHIARCVSGYLFTSESAPEATQRRGASSQTSAELR